MARATIAITIAAATSTTTTPSTSPIVQPPEAPTTMVMHTSRLSLSLGDGAGRSPAGSAADALLVAAYSGPAGTIAQARALISVLRSRRLRRARGRSVVSLTRRVT